MSTEWFYHRNGKNAGPLSSQQIREAVKNGWLSPSDLIWKQGLKTWVLASKIQGLFPKQYTQNSQCHPPENLPPLPTITKNNNLQDLNDSSTSHSTPSIEFKMVNEQKQEFLSIQQRKCPSCGAKVQIRGSSEQAKCEYCNAEFTIVRPVSIQKHEMEGADQTDKKRYNNLIKILENALIAENYKEAYEYCNKALEMDPDNGAVWENKALCSLYLVPASSIEDCIPQIQACLDTATNINPNSSTFKRVSRTISDTIYFYTKLWIYSVSPDMRNERYSLPMCNTILKKIKTWEQCYQIYNDLTYLEGMVDELSGKGKLNWRPIEKDIPTSQLREKIIKIIQRREPSYTPPSCSDYKALIYTVLFFLLLFVIRSCFSS